MSYPVYRLDRNYGVKNPAMSRAWWSFAFDNVRPAEGALIVVWWSSDDIYLIGRAGVDGVTWLSPDGGDLTWHDLTMQRADWRYFYH